MAFLIPLLGYSYSIFRLPVFPQVTAHFTSKYPFSKSPVTLCVNFSFLGTLASRFACMAFFCLPFDGIFGSFQADQKGVELRNDGELSVLAAISTHTRPGL